MGHRTRTFIIVVGCAAILAPTGAVANHSCASRVVVFSGRADAGQDLRFGNPNAPVCGATGGAAEAHADGRIIVPGSNRISVRYTIDLGEEVTAVPIELRGLGFAGRIVDAPRTTNVVSDATRLLFGVRSYVYETPGLAIDPNATGTITATVLDPATREPLDATTFRTVGG